MAQSSKVKSSDAHGERAEGGASDDDLSSAHHSINALGHRLKDLFQAKQWRQLGAELGMSTLWYFDEPLRIDEALARAEAQLHDSQELEVRLERILSSTASESATNGSYTCYLMWVEAATWQQREEEFDLHLGFRKEDERWHLSYLGITAATPDEVPFPEDAPDASTENGPPPRQPNADHVLVYVPAWLPRHMAQMLLEAGAAREFAERDPAIDVDLKQKAEAP